MENLRLKTPSVDDEVLPLEPYYNKGFQISLRDGVEIAKAAVKCLENSTEARKPDSGLGGILQSALELSHFDAPATRTIGVVGDSAAGDFDWVFEWPALADVECRKEQSHQLFTRQAGSCTYSKRTVSDLACNSDLSRETKDLRSLPSLPNTDTSPTNRPRILQSRQNI
jgi:hypothetical protein